MGKAATGRRAPSCSPQFCRSFNRFVGHAPEDAPVPLLLPWHFRFAAPQLPPGRAREIGGNSLDDSRPLIFSLFSASWPPHADPRRPGCSRLNGRVQHERAREETSHPSTRSRPNAIAHTILPSRGKAPALCPADVPRTQRVAPDVRE